MIATDFVVLTWSAKVASQLRDSAVVKATAESDCCARMLSSWLQVAVVGQLLQPIGTYLLVQFQRPLLFKSGWPGDRLAGSEKPSVPSRSAAVAPGRRLDHGGWRGLVLLDTGRRGIHRAIAAGTLLAKCQRDQVKAGSALCLYSPIERAECPYPESGADPC